MHTLRIQRDIDSDGISNRATKEIIIEEREEVLAPIELIKRCLRRRTMRREIKRMMRYIELELSANAVATASSNDSIGVGTLALQKRFTTDLGKLLLEDVLGLEHEERPVMEHKVYTFNEAPQARAISEFWRIPLK